MAGYNYLPFHSHSRWISQSLALVAELGHRIEDRSLLNADVPSYLRRIEAQSRATSDERIAGALQSIFTSLREFDYSENVSPIAVTPPRIYTGNAGIMPLSENCSSFISFDC